ncbi:MAG: MoxR family ATPase [Thermodesulfobacteriota bacterium]|nr:MoxR family ATPase [Thermodesulfobacteriota bacterium]
MRFKDIEDVKTRLENAGYICSDEIATVVFLAGATGKPVLVEGPAGVGKTELAKAVSKSLGIELIRLQCYEGLDESKALYEWEYAKQLLYTQMVKEKISLITQDTDTLSAAVDRIAAEEDAFFSERFIQPRPLLKAIMAEEKTTLLIDEVDKSDPEFEAFLLEILSDFQITIPEIGTKKAKSIPLVFLTSNNYRDMSDALKRRCIHLYIDYPERQIEIRIVEMKKPGISRRLSENLVDTIKRIRGLDLKKKPCISETLDWAESLVALQVEDLSEQVIGSTLNMICKYRSDTQMVQDNMARIIKSAG